MPSRPAYVSYSATKENFPKLKALKKFPSTTSNITDPLPLMSAKPHKFHLKEYTVSFAAQVPVPIPHHGKDEVKRQLEKDIQKAQIERSDEW